MAERPACAAPAPPASHPVFHFEPLDTGLPQVAQWRDGFAVADMDGDGDLDLVHGPPRKGAARPFLFRNDGTGHFSVWSEAHFPPLPYDYGDVEVADVNQDGAPDIALASHLRGLVVMISEKPGSFAPWSGGLAYAPPGAGQEAPFASRELALVDWNRDRRIDVVALNEGPTRMATSARAPEAFAVFLNRGGFWDPIPAGSPSGLFGDAMAVGDVDADGFPDAVLGADVSGTNDLIRLGRGTSWNTQPIRSLPPRASLSALLTRNLDQQRGDEIVAGMRYIDGDRNCAALDILRWRASEEQNTYLWSEETRDPISALALDDFDADGHIDLLAVRSQGRLMLFAGGSNGFTRDAVLDPPAWLAGCEAYDAHSADLNGDRRPEVIVSFAGETSIGNRSCNNGGGFLTLSVVRRAD